MSQLDRLNTKLQLTITQAQGALDALEDAVDVIDGERIDVLDAGKALHGVVMLLAGAQYQLLRVAEEMAKP